MVHRINLRPHHLNSAPADEFIYLFIYFRGSVIRGSVIRGSVTAVQLSAVQLSAVQLSAVQLSGHPL